MDSTYISISFLKQIMSTNEGRSNARADFYIKICKGIQNGFTFYDKWAIIIVYIIKTNNVNESIETTR